MSGGHPGKNASNLVRNAGVFNLHCFCLFVPGSKNTHHQRDCQKRSSQPHLRIYSGPRTIPGGIIAIWVLKPVFNIDILSGALIAIGFQGGHGTIAAIVFGSIMSNLSSGHGKDDMQMTKKEELIKVKRTSMTLQLAFIGTSIALGWLVLQSLKGIEGLLVKESPEGFIRFIPLFPVAMLAGLMILAGAGILYNLIIYFINNLLFGLYF